MILLKQFYDEFRFSDKVRVLPGTFSVNFTSVPKCRAFYRIELGKVFPINFF